jgi:hypothetical protein
MRKVASSPVFAAVVAALTGVACGRGSNSAKIDTTTPQQPPAAAASAPSADTMTLVRGTVARVSAAELVVKTDTSSVTVKVAPPLRVFSRAPSDVARVTPNAFIGVTTVKQADGSERATEIHIFPEELRGLGEGSRMMTPAAGASSPSPSRMTNGSVSGSTPATGTAPASRMSNGSVASTNGSTLVVQYAGGSQTVTVPPSTPVTEIKQVSKPLAVGDQVVVIATKGSDGSLVSGKALLTTK